MKNLSLLKTVCVVFVFCAATAIASPAQVLTTLHSFAGSDGANPTARLVQASDGNLYGTTIEGGANNYGAVYKTTPGGTLTTLYSFAGSDGDNPWAGLVQAIDGNFYGTTAEGGTNNCVPYYGCGTVFKITSSGTLTTLHSFAGSDGANPYAGLVQASDGNFYGTTENGGANNCAPYYGCGTVFKITSSGALTTLHSFARSDGAYPGAGLVQASDGNFYGTTYVGGTNNYGTVFKITPTGTLTTLHSFNGTDGGFVSAGLTAASDGNFYGTTENGGANNYGTVFKITPQGTLTTLHSFDGSDGANPADGLLQASDGNFYGATSYGGASNDCYGGCGTVFKITSSGTLTTLHSFAGSDGANPPARLVQASDGNLYGTTYVGGADGRGTVFRLVTVRACAICPSIE